MKNYLPVICVLISGAMISSCGYQSLADADYPEQQIYMPGSSSGLYSVSDLPPETGAANYTLDLKTGELLIPLCVYRAGTDNDGEVTASLELNNDSLQTLINAGKLTSNKVKPTLIPLDRATVPETVVIPNGVESTVFNLSVDLDFLMVHPNTRFVVGVKLNDANRSVVSSMSYMMVEVNTRFIVPTVGFTCRVTNDATYEVTFTNTSAYGFDYTWDFGDGTDPYVGEDPGVHNYPSSGSYTIKLTARGITEHYYTHSYTLRIWENITEKYIANYGPFKRKDSGGKTGTLSDWLYTDNILGSNGKGGFYLENGGVMDFYNSSKDQTNAKIYQTFTLPAGNYKAAFTPYSFRGTNDCYYVVASGSELPDIENINSSSTLGSYHWTSDIGKDQQGIEFTLKSETQVTLGFVVSHDKTSRVQISAVALYQ